jgi:hypothetical protein
MIQKTIFIYILSCLALSCNERSKDKSPESIDLCTEYTINEIWNDSLLLQNYFLNYFEEPNKDDITKDKLLKFVRIINYRKDDTCSIYTFKIGTTCTNLSIKKTEPVFFNLMKSNSTELNKNIVYIYERKIFYFVNFKELTSHLSNLYVIQAPYEEENKTQVEYFDGEKYNTQFYKSYDIAFLEQIIIKLK